MTPARRILIRGPNWIGDNVMALPAYRALREFYPSAHLTLWVKSPCDQLPLEMFDQILPLSASIPKNNFDLAFSFPHSVSAALSLYQLKIPVRVGYAEFLARSFFTDSLPWMGRKSGKHKSQLYLELVEWASACSLLPEPLSLRGTNVASDAAIPSVVIAPEASIGLREWPYFKDLILELHAQSIPMQIVGTRHRDQWDLFIEQYQLNGVINSIGKTSIPELLSVLKSSKAVIANDSGIAHLSATLLEKTTLVLMGPGDPNYILPTGPHVHYLVPADLPCHPCERAICRSPYLFQGCLRQITVNQVITSTKTIIEQ